MSEEFDVVVIGAGPGGYVAAIRASQLGLKTACIEKRKELGGTCLNVGCIPSKTLLSSSENVWNLKTRFSSLGIEVADWKLNFLQMMKKKQEVIGGFVQGIDLLFKKNKITRFLGHAKLIDPHSVEVNGKQIQAKHIILATGSEPASLPFLPFDEKKVVSSTGALEFQEVPKKLLVVGAGIIGVELGSVYQRLGSEVVFIEFLDHICPGFDLALSKFAHKIFESQNMKFHLSHKLVSADISQAIKLSAEGPNGPAQFEGDAVLVAIGRKPYSDNLGIEELDIIKDEKGFVKIDGCFRTKHPHIFAIGDLVEGPMLAHKAMEEGTAVAEFIAGKAPELEYLTIPSVSYTNPEIASVGFTEDKLKEKGIEYLSGQFSFKANSRAKCSGEDEGFVKILADKKSLNILGGHMIGPHVSELIGQVATAMQGRMSVSKLAKQSFAHPTLSEAIKEAALACFDKPIHS